MSAKNAICYLIFLFSASIALGADPGVYFYRTPQSLFASGQTSIATLTKKLSGNEFLFHYLIEQNHRRQWVAAEVVARDLELSSRVTYQNREYNLTDLRGYWALIESPSQNRRDWAPLLDLRPCENDRGLAMTLIPTSLRVGPSWSSEMILTLPARTRLEILEIQDSWLRVRFDSSQIGFVDLNNVLLKADFASAVRDGKGLWQKVTYRESSWLHLENKKMISLNDVRAWRTDSSQATVVKIDDEKSLLLRQNVKIIKTEAQIWGVSELKEHGRVYWKRNDIRAGPAADNLILSKEDLLKREVFSVAWDEKNPRVGLVSSHGIFSTLDSGETWSFVESFKNENHPVSIAPDGTWFVGFHRSRDRGHTFTNYVRTDFLTKLIESQSLRAPRILKLAGIEFKNSRLQLRLDTGVKHVLLATKSKEEMITDWDFTN